MTIYSTFKKYKGNGVYYFLDQGLKSNNYMIIWIESILTILSHI